MKTAHLFFYLSSLGFIFSLCSCTKSLYNPSHSTITQEDFMSEMVSIDAEPCFPIHTYTTKHVSSYDRRSVLPGTPSWHANRDNTGFIRYEANNGRVEKVLFDEKGPGVLTRILTTGGASGANLRIYFDDEKEASIFIPAYDISQFPIDVPAGLLYKHEHYPTSQGSSFYYPLPYAKSCKITVDNVDRDYFFHTACRTYPKGTKIQTFTLANAKALQNKTLQLSEQLLHPKAYTENRETKEQKLSAHSSFKMEFPKGERAVRNLSISVTEVDSADYASLMRALIVKISFDGTQTVSVPLSDLTGAGMGAPEVHSYYLEADGKGNSQLRFVMPYRREAHIEIENISEHPAKIKVVACISAWKWYTNTLYFHAGWKQENSLETNKGLDYNMGTLQGRGVFKGDMLSLYNHSPRWYGEGDEHIWIDNESFPSHFGCGTEDYYNTTFAPIHPYFNPFGGAPREDDEASRGYNTFVRTRNLDIVPFNERLQFDFELISWDGGKVDYASTLFWYGDLETKMINCSGKKEALYTLPLAIFTGDK